MKRFRWSLQRLFDVTVQREKALRLELLRLSRQTAAIKQQVLARRTLLEGQLADLAAQKPTERLPRQELFMNCSGVCAQAIRTLEGRLHEAESRRGQTLRRFQSTKTSRETLERLYEEARREYLRQQGRIEQNELDEAAHVAFAQKAMRSRVADAG